MINNFNKIIQILFVLVFILNFGLSAQSDSLESHNSDKLVFKPAFHSIQLDANIFIISYEIGGQLDFDFFQSINNICIGTRISAEHYILGDFGGTTSGSPFTNYNLYVRFSNTLGYFSIDALGGISFYKTSQPNYFPNEYLPRIGIEIKYGKVVGIILKGATSFKNRTGFIGIGVSLNYNHLL